MALLEFSAPLEALSIRYAATLVGSTWTWLAVVFAALGLWHIRAASQSESQQPVPDPPGSATAHVGPAEDARSSSALDEKLPPRSCRVDESGGGMPKGRFTAYFHVDGNVDEDDVAPDQQGDEEVDDVSEVETLMELRSGDLGWYRCQDLTVINGSVVRFWKFENGGCKGYNGKSPK